MGHRQIFTPDGYRTTFRAPARARSGALFARIGLTQFDLNRAHLLAEVELPLMLLDLQFGLSLHVLHHPSACELALQS